MSRVTYVNGRYLHHGEAAVSVEDRAFQFADGVYDVWEVRAGEFVEEIRHLERLEYCMRELSIRPPLRRPALQLVMREIVRRNHVRDGMVYVQVTRGAARRDHVFPPAQVRSTIVVSARSLDPEKIEARAQNGIAVASAPDLRWRRPDLKTTSLLPNVLAKQAAHERGAQEAWLVDDSGFVTEGAASNAWIVSREGRLVTRKPDRTILRGVTRTWLLDAVAGMQLQIEERPFTINEAYDAAEAFITGATAHVMPVVKIDDHLIGMGKPGPLTLKLRAALIK